MDNIEKIAKLEKLFAIKQIEFNEVNATLGILQKRFWKDRATMQEALESEGYRVYRNFEGQIELEPPEATIDNPPDGA